MNDFEHSLLQYYNKKQLEKIQSINIGIGGAGGLGSNLAILLVRSGFKTIEIIDYDKIEASNLNRQQYYLEEVGQNKVDTLKNHLLKINPHIEVNCTQIMWNPENASSFFHNCDIVVECFDDAKEKTAFIDFYQDKTKYIVSGNGMAGLDFNKPLITKKIGNVIVIGDQETEACEKNPPMTSRVTMCASMMAEMVLKLVLHNL